MGNQIVWEIYPYEKTESLVQRLEEALREDNPEEIVDYLRDAKFLRSMVVARGNKNYYFNILVEAFSLLIKDSLKTNFFWDRADLSLINVLHKKNIPEQILNELAHIAFHLRDKKTFFDIWKFIERNRDHFENKRVYVRAIHDLASWHSVHGDKELARKENKQALELARKEKEPIIETKAKFGLSYNKNELKPRELAEDFLVYAETLGKHNLGYDAVRAKIEAARAMLKWALRQDKKERKKRLLETKNIALDALKSAKDLRYPNSEILAREVLAAVYKELKEDRKVKSYGKAAGKLRKDYDYKT